MPQYTRRAATSSFLDVHYLLDIVVFHIFYIGYVVYLKYQSFLLWRKTPKYLAYGKAIKDGNNFRAYALGQLERGGMPVELSDIILDVIVDRYLPKPLVFYADGRVAAGICNSASNPRRLETLSSQILRHLSSFKLCVDNKHGYTLDTTSHINAQKRLGRRMQGAILENAIAVLPAHLPTEETPRHLPYGSALRGYAGALRNIHLRIRLPLTTERTFPDSVYQSLGGVADIKNLFPRLKSLKLDIAEPRKILLAERKPHCNFYCGGLVESAVLLALLRELVVAMRKVEVQERRIHYINDTEERKVWEDNVLFDRRVRDVSETEAEEVGKMMIKMEAKVEYAI